MDDLWFWCQCSNSGSKGLSCQQPAIKIQGIKNFLDLASRHQSKVHPVSPMDHFLARTGPRPHSRNT